MMFTVTSTLADACQQDDAFGWPAVVVTLGSLGMIVFIIAFILWLMAR